MCWIEGAGRREFPFNLQRRRITGLPGDLHFTKHAARLWIQIENEGLFFIS